MVAAEADLLQEKTPEISQTPDFFGGSRGLDSSQAIKNIGLWWNAKDSARAFSALMRIADAMDKSTITTICPGTTGGRYP